MVAPTDREAVDLEIYRALERGDKDAFSRLVREHGTHIYNVSYRILMDRVRAEDVMQETFMKAYSSIDTLEDPRRLRVWLVKIAHNKSVDVLRRDKRAEARRTAHEREVAIEDTAPDRAVGDGERRALRACLEALPPEKRAAVLGRFVDELEYGELAESSGEKIDTVRIRVARTLPELRECLEKKGVKL
ncbi:MAG: RNA polymerase sigma factor [Deltaproteobacteria bacterium]|nr:RNA polymerase sigma factor [Deltaproteobacteria bacterium]MCW5801066.1 RNA polymerase sigma factor [Deltaproteobacteria bacterium]